MGGVAAGALRLQSQQLSVVSDILPTALITSMPDASNGFHSVPLRDSDRHLTTYHSPFTGCVLDDETQWESTLLQATRARSPSMTCLDGQDEDVAGHYAAEKAGQRHGPCKG